MSRYRQKFRIPSRPRAKMLATAMLALALSGAGAPAHAAPDPVKIVVFDFELSDRSAGGGVIAADAVDIDNLKLATAEARRKLADSGRYRVIDAGSVSADLVEAGGISHCNGCEGTLARQVGADQAMVGLLTRVNRTEYTLQILVRDTATGEVVSNDFSGLRMGANYAWPRGVRWLMDRKILAR